jgi:ankyrin repeat protein
VSCVDLLSTKDIGRLRVLLESGCDPNTVHPTTGASALYNACFVDKVDVVRLLLEHGANPNKLLTYCSPVDGRIDAGVVAMRNAHSVPVVSALLDAGADPNIQDQRGRTPLMTMVLSSEPDVVEVLLAAGAKADLRTADDRTAADAVRARLQWCRDLKSPGPPVFERIGTLKRILELLGESEQA